MTAEEQVYEEERLHDQFTLLLQDVETYLQPVTAELDAVLRYLVLSAVRSSSSLLSSSLTLY